jgi:predicted phosphate transport protein (TIGR00153 family)
MPGLMSRLLPHEESFFDMFSAMADNVCGGAKVFVEMLHDFSDPAGSAEKVKEFEHQNDTLVHSLMTKLNQTFITPFDREDIHELASEIDDVLDLTDAAASRLVLYGVQSIRPGVAEMAEVLRAATEQVAAAIRGLNKKNGILDHCIEINRLENEADRQCRALIADLFLTEKDPVEIIKWKEIIEVIEIATDKCEDVANVIETVTLKNA